MSNSSDQCALNADGTLKPTAEIDFYFDKDDNVPMAGPTAATKGQIICSSLSLSVFMYWIFASGQMCRLNTGGHLTELLDAEQWDEHGQLTAPPKTRCCTKKKKGKRKTQAKASKYCWLLITYYILIIFVSKRKPLVAQHQIPMTVPSLLTMSQRLAWICRDQTMKLPTTRCVCNIYPLVFFILTSDNVIDCRYSCLEDCPQQCAEQAEAHYSRGDWQQRKHH